MKQDYIINKIWNFKKIVFINRLYSRLKYSDLVKLINSKNKAY